MKILRKKQFSFILTVFCLLTSFFILNSTSTEVHAQLTEEMRGVREIAIGYSTVLIEDEFNKDLPEKIRKTILEVFEVLETDYDVYLYDSATPLYTPRLSVEFQINEQKDGSFYGYSILTLSRVVTLYPPHKNGKPFWADVFKLPKVIFIPEKQKIERYLLKETKDYIFAFLKIIEFETDKLKSDDQYS